MLRIVHNFLIMVSVAALGFAVQAKAAPASPNAIPGRLYCCVDIAGRQACGDTLPQACYGRAYREIGPNGQTIREVAAPLTPEQRAQRAREDEQRRLEDIKRKKQQLQDQALLNSYGTLEELELRRKRMLDEANAAIKGAEEKIAAVTVERKKFENEAEFYKKRALPMEVEKGLRDTEFELKNQETLIVTRRKEIETMQAKFDEDLKRLTELLAPQKTESQP